MQQYAEAFVARFFSHVDRSDPNGCWPWMARRRCGYGQVAVGRRMVQAHRVAYEIANGPISLQIDCLHKCDNPPCCREDHLFLGDAKANIADMIAKGRGNWACGDKNASRKYPERRPRGSRHGRAKLSESDAVEIKQLLADGLRRSAIANRFGVTKGAITQIANKRSWRYIDAHMIRSGNQQLPGLE